MLYFSCIMLNPSVRRGLSPLLFVRSSGIKGYTLPRAKTNNAYELISSLKVFFHARQSESGTENSYT